MTTDMKENVIIGGALVGIIAAAAVPMVLVARGGKIENPTEVCPTLTLLTGEKVRECFTIPKESVGTLYIRGGSSGYYLTYRPTRRSLGTPALRYGVINVVEEVENVR